MLFLIKFVKMKRLFYLTFVALPIISGSSRILSKYEAFEKYLNRLYHEHSITLNNEHRDIFGDQPEAAAWQNFLMTFDPTLGRVPLERLEKVYQQIKANHFYRAGNQLSWSEVSSDMGGRVRALMSDPNTGNGKKIWAGSVTGGLWYNPDITDSNSSWISASGFQENLSVSSICYDPNNTKIFYAGTGEAFTARVIYRESSGKGSGIFKSTDGGNTWTRLISTKDFAYVTDIVVRNENGQSVVYASVVSGVY